MDRPKPSINPVPIWVTGLALGVGACNAGVKPAAPGWIAQIGGPGAEIVFDVAETSDGRLCAAGTFFVRSEFGAGERATWLQADAVEDIYLACYTRDGRLASATQFGGRSGDQPRAVAALPDGDILLTGFFADRFGADKKASLTADVNADVFLTRLDAEGGEVWARQFGGKLADNGNAVAVAEDGSILLAGTFQDTMFYPRDGKTRKVYSAGSKDAFVFKLDRDGRVLWVRRFGGTSRDEGTAVAAGPGGQVLLAGTFQGEAGAGETGEQLTAAGSADAFLAAFSAEGEALWSRRIGGENRERVSGLAAGADLQIYLAGTFLADISLAGDRRLESRGSADVFVARFDADGALERAVSFGGPYIDEVYDLAVTPDGELLLTGHFQGRADFAPGPRTVELSASGERNSDGFLLMLDRDGNFRSATGFGGNGVEMGFGVIALAGGGAAVSGLMNENLAFGVANLAPLETRGKTDVFIARLPRLTAAGETG